MLQDISQLTPVSVLGLIAYMLVRDVIDRRRINGLGPANGERRLSSVEAHYTDIQRRLDRLEGTVSRISAAIERLSANHFKEN